MAVIGFDTSTPQTGVCVVMGPHAHSLNKLANRPGEDLAPLVHAALSQCQIMPSDLEAIGVGLGPGPFTGLRVGIVFAAAMGHALGIPVYGICSLDAFVSDGVAVTDARRKEVYWARYRDGARVDGPFVTKPDQVDIRPGDQVMGTRLYPDFVDAQGSEYPSAEYIAHHAAGQLALVAHPAALTPLYLRRPDADESFSAKSVLT